MEKDNLKNIVVLKNLPSNLVDEAIVILKPNKRIKKLEIVNKNKNLKSKDIEKKKEGYVLKEAEMLISNYISKIEKSENKNIRNNKLKKKYKRLQMYAVISNLILIISIVLNFI